MPETMPESDGIPTIDRATAEKIGQHGGAVVDAIRRAVNGEDVDFTRLGEVLDAFRGKATGGAGSKGPTPPPQAPPQQPRPAQPAAALPAAASAGEFMGPGPGAEHLFVGPPIGSVAGPGARAPSAYPGMPPGWTPGPAPGVAQGAAPPSMAPPAMGMPSGMMPGGAPGMMPGMDPMAMIGMMMNRGVMPGGMAGAATGVPPQGAAPRGTPVQPQRRGRRGSIHTAPQPAQEQEDLAVQLDTLGNEIWEDLQAQFGGEVEFVITLNHQGYRIAAVLPADDVTPAEVLFHVDGRPEELGVQLARAAVEADKRLAGMFQEARTPRK